MYVFNIPISKLKIFLKIWKLLLKKIIKKKNIYSNSILLKCLFYFNLNVTETTYDS